MEKAIDSDRAGKDSVSLSDWLGFATEEYKTVRTECLESVKSQQTSIRYGSAGIAAFVIVGLNQWENLFVCCLTFMFFAPFTAYLFVYIWLGEVGRMMRAGHYIWTVERVIASAFPSWYPPLAWESWLRLKQGGKTPQMKNNYHAVAALFIGTAVCGVIIGNLRVVGADTYGFGRVVSTHVELGLVRFDLNVLLAVLMSLVNVLELVAFFHVYRYYRRAEHDFSSQSIPSGVLRTASLRPFFPSDCKVDV